MKSALCLPELQVGSACRLEYWHLSSEQWRLTSAALTHLNSFLDCTTRPKGSYGSHL